MNAEAVRHFLARQGLPAERIERAAKEGVANAVWLTDTHVVRIGKDPEYTEDAYTESVAAPIAFAAGIPTPRPIAFDFDGSDPVSIFERVPGQTLAQTRDLPDPEAFFRDFARAVRRLHDAVREAPDPHGYLDPAWELAIDEILEACPPEAHSRVEAWAALPTGEPVFCHQDLHAENVMVHDGRLAAFIDWGDAGWAERAVDLRFVPARYLDAALDAYGAEPNVRVRARLHVLDQFLYARDDGLTYGPYGDSEWEEILRWPPE